MRFGRSIVFCRKIRFFYAVLLPQAFFFGLNKRVLGCKVVFKELDPPFLSGETASGESRQPPPSPRKHESHGSVCTVSLHTISGSHGAGSRFTRFIYISCLFVWIGCLFFVVQAALTPHALFFPPINACWTINCFLQEDAFFLCRPTAAGLFLCSQ